MTTQLAHNYEQILEKFQERAKGIANRLAEYAFENREKMQIADNHGDSRYYTVDDIGTMDYESHNKHHLGDGKHRIVYSGCHYGIVYTMWKGFSMLARDADASYPTFAILPEDNLEKIKDFIEYIRWSPSDMDKLTVLGFRNEDNFLDEASQKKCFQSFQEKCWNPLMQFVDDYSEQIMYASSLKSKFLNIATSLTRSSILIENTFSELAQSQEKNKTEKIIKICDDLKNTGFIFKAAGRNGISVPSVNQNLVRTVRYLETNLNEKLEEVARICNDPKMLEACDIIRSTFKDYIDNEPFFQVGEVINSMGREAKLLDGQFRAK